MATPTFSSRTLFLDFRQITLHAISGQIRNYMDRPSLTRAVLTSESEESLALPP